MYGQYAVLDINRSLNPILLFNYSTTVRVGWITSDGTAVNRTTIRELKKHLTINDLGWTANEHDILCMEHALHLAAKHFVETIVPTTSTAITKKVRAALKKSSHRGDLDLDELDHELAEINLDEPDTDGNSESDNEDFSFHPGDSLGKALALVKQIRKSPQAHTFFKSTCTQVDIDPLELLLWVRTRWALLYQFLECLFKQKLAVDQFILLADDSDKVPDLPASEQAAEHLDEDIDVKDPDYIANDS
ncbi:hypothetical protein BDQ17DRAFT_1417641 [Cyathus striatus]|nr:hypothetical protein BDQ17DRAFT_1417641 [Cyathus striatus]